ncbi:hypothetical protein [Amycolatopsis aidingensis]|uniref:hypothetical protein n=1 Tax=Amycolatopsis aidingensis TaxID=2842453 RepID=UPI001C0DA8DF|nr:hypothetical protein [Amycolatopsis aidingensis]
MTQPEPHPNPDHGRFVPAPAGHRSSIADDQGLNDRRWDRIRVIRVSCTIITVLCGLFAAVLVAQIIMIAGDANPANGVATFVQSWSAGVSLGFDDLFTPASATTTVLLNNGLAALVWLGLGAVVTTLIRRLATPGPSRAPGFAAK